MGAEKVRLCNLTLEQGKCRMKCEKLAFTRERGFKPQGPIWKGENNTSAWRCEKGDRDPHWGTGERTASAGISPT